MGEKEEYYLGIDVGTSSVRAGLVNPAGRVLHFSTEEITIRNPRHLSSQSSHIFFGNQNLQHIFSSMNMDRFV
jgi:ribulose kinase